MAREKLTPKAKLMNIVTPLASDDIKDVVLEYDNWPKDNGISEIRIVLAHKIYLTDKKPTKGK